MTETPTYTLDGLVLNATDGSGVDWIVEDESGWSDAAPVRLSADERAGADGGLSGQLLRGARLIVLTGTAIAADRHQMLLAKERLRAAAAGTGPYALVVAEEHLTRRALVKQFDQVKIKDKGSYAFTFEVSLRADDPRRYAVAASTAGPLVLEVLDPEPGLRFPVRFPVSFGASSPGEEATVSNVGNADAYPVLTITGPAAYPLVRNLSTGDYSRYRGTLAGGDVLVLDHGAGAARLNGAADVRRLITGTGFWALPPGDSTLAFRAASNTAAQLTVSYRAAWT